MVTDLLEHPDLARRDTSSLQARRTAPPSARPAPRAQRALLWLQQVVGAGGAAVPPSQLRRMQAKLSRATPTQGYGLTETCGGIAYALAPKHMQLHRLGLCLDLDLGLHLGLDL